MTEGEKAAKELLSELTSNGGENMSKMILIRGLPGSGKSTLAREIAEKESAVILSTDDFWMKDGKYQFDVTRLTEAHEWNQQRAQDALSEGWSVVIDNTNVLREHMRPYEKMAKEAGAEIEEKIAPLNGEDVETLFRNNSHDVPFHIIEKMRKQWED
jgi:predicted kinase